MTSLRVLATIAVVAFVGGSAQAQIATASSDAQIDKVPRDFPNDLLNEMERLYFRVPELQNAGSPGIGHPNDRFGDLRPRHRQQQVRRHRQSQDAELCYGVVLFSPSLR